MSNESDMEKALREINGRISALENTFASGKKSMEAYSNGLKPVIDGITKDVSYIKIAIDDLRSALSSPPDSDR